MGGLAHRGGSCLEGAMNRAPTRRSAWATSAPQRVGHIRAVARGPYLRCGA